MDFAGAVPDEMIQPTDSPSTFGHGVICGPSRENRSPTIPQRKQMASWFARILMVRLVLGAIARSR